MIGKIYCFLTPYYNASLGKMDYKKRPALIIGISDRSDYAVLPVSRVTNPVNLDLNYDIKIDPSVYPLSGLKFVSYVRTHKQTVFNAGELGSYVGDLKTDYEDLYLEILEKLEEYNGNLLSKAI